MGVGRDAWSKSEEFGHSKIEKKMDKFSKVWFCCCCIGTNEKICENENKFK